MKWYSEGCGGGERRERETEIEGESCNYLEKERERKDAIGATNK